MNQQGFVAKAEDIADNVSEIFNYWKLIKNWIFTIKMF